MAVVLFRVDDRLVHGQVTSGWGRVLKPARIVVINDSLAASSWEMDLFRSAIPEEIIFEVLTVEQAASIMPRFCKSSEKVFVLIEDLHTLVSLVERGAEIGPVNLGGLHFDDGKEEILPYVYLNKDDVKILLWLREHGVDIRAQDVPSGKITDIFTCIDKTEEN